MSSMNESEAQRRAERRRDAFVDAALDLIVSDEVGAIGLSVGDVVTIARWLAPTAVELADVEQAGLRRRWEVLRAAIDKYERDAEFQLEMRLRADAKVAAIRALHHRIDVPGLPGTSLGPFSRCSCTPGLLYDECPTVAALATIEDAQP
jgi:hypothetical protein